MALARQTEAHKIKPLPSAHVDMFIIGAAVEAGEIVALQSDGFWGPAVATGVVKTAGIAVKAAGVGDEIDIVWGGPVECLTGATPGDWVYISDTAGEPSHTAGTKAFIIGYALTATRLMVQPQPVAFS